MSRTSKGPTEVPITASELRANIYRLLDGVLETGAPLEVARHGRRLRIVRADMSKLDRIVPDPDLITGDADELACWDWSAHLRWDPDDPLFDVDDPA